MTDSTEPRAEGHTHWCKSVLGGTAAECDCPQNQPIAHGPMNQPLPIAKPTTDTVERAAVLEAVASLSPGFANVKIIREELCSAIRDLPSAARGEAVSSADFQQRRGAAMDIIDEALEEYRGFMLDDDYDAMRCLERIMERMDKRRAALQQEPTK